VWRAPKIHHWKTSDPQPKTFDFLIFGATVFSDQKSAFQSNNISKNGCEIPAFPTTKGKTS